MNVFRVFAWVWSCVRDLMTVLRPCRFSVAIILAGFLLMFTPQGSELTVRLPEEGPARIFWFMFAVFLWALESWYWARLTLDATFGDYENEEASLDHPRPGRMRWLIKTVPRALAAAAYAIAAIPCLFAEAWFIAILVAVEGVAFYVLIVLRRWLVRKFLDRRPAGWKERWFAMRRKEWVGLRALPLFSLALAVGSMLLAVGLTVWVCAHVVSFGAFFGSAAIPFLGFAMIVPVGSLAVYLTRVGGRARMGEPGPDMETLSRGYPVLASLLILAVIWSLFSALDNHKVRELEGKRPIPAVKFSEFVQRWQQQPSASANANTRPVIVATAGGGLRAAYWTATVLGHIQDKAPEFRDHLLAVSGVSGGSLGATLFLTLLAQDKPLGDTVKSDRCTELGLEGQYECAGQMLLSQDFLGPAVAGLLFPDLINRFVPVGLPDRAQALEQSWEASWPRIGFEKSVWTDTEFRELWNARTRLPALLLNGTHVESGKRVITSNVKVTLDVFPDAYDFYDMVPYGIRPSTAAHNSARFTYVSPAGRLKDDTHLVDGGYFENFGAATARQLLRTALTELGVGAQDKDNPAEKAKAAAKVTSAQDNRCQPQGERRVRPIVILISNDPELKDDDFARGPDGKLRQHDAKVWGGEVLSPLRAMLHTRNARGLLAVAELRIDVEAAGGCYVEFRLCEDQKTGREKPALGWVLSRPAEGLMREQMRQGCNNDRELARLIDALRN